MTALQAREWDVIIIGSGISSLTCAALLAKAGQNVLVAERYAKAGGYLHCFERFGHRFDTGAHYSGGLGEGEPFRALLTYLGITGDDLFVPLAADGFDVMRFRDFEVSIPRGYDAVISALSDQFPADAAAVRSFFTTVRETARGFSTYNFARVDAPAAPADAGALDTSLESVVSGLTSNPRLACVLYAYCALHGVAPADVSIGLHSLLTDSLVRGAWGFRNGGERLARGFTGAIERLGGTVACGAGVAELRTDGRRIVEVVLDDGEVHRAKLVVSGIHPKATFRLLAPFRPSPAFAARLDGLEETLSFLGVYAACSELPRVDRDRNYYFFDWAEPAAFGQLRGAGQDGAPVRRSAFVCRPDRVAPPGPPGLCPVSVHAPAKYAWFKEWEQPGAAPGGRRRKPRAYYERKLELAEESLAFVDRQLPGFRRSVVKYDVSTPLSNLRFNGSEQGTAYGIYHSMRNTGARAIGPRTHVENLLLTGQSSLFPGLLGAAVSGLRTAGNLIGIKNILRDLSPMVAL